jgi:hypothetical protein
MDTLAVPLGELDQTAELDVAQPTGDGGERPGVACHVVHQVLMHRHHERERHEVGGSVHHPEHVHLHGHARGRHRELVVAGGIDDSPVGDLLSADAAVLHEHVHVAIGQHDLAGFVRVIAHHAERRVTVGAGGGPLGVADRCPTQE